MNLKIKIIFTFFRAKFPTPEYEPEYVQATKEKSRLGSFSKLKSAIRM